MNQFWKVFVLVLIISVMTSHRLPAPLKEEPTPSPTGEQRTKPKPKPKADASDESRQPKQNRSPFAAFEGVWSGTVNITATATLLFSSTASTSAPVTIRVSKTGIVNYAGEQPVQGFLSPDRRVLTFNIQKQISDTTWHQNGSLQLTGPNVANYSDTSRSEAGIAATSGKSSGTLYRR